jgi:hypothetical protein
LKEFEEKPEFNQYWYSQKTIDRIVEEVVRVGGRVGFLSTPSLYFALPESVRESCFVFDIDEVWKNDRGFVLYDFNSPDTLREDLHNSFDMVVVDPPFITEEVWRKYAIASKILLKSGKDESTGLYLGKVILTTIYENKNLLKELLDAESTAFLPSIPNLVYQYNLFTNYPALSFERRNEEIPE